MVTETRIIKETRGETNKHEEATKETKGVTETQIIKGETCRVRHEGVTKKLKQVEVTTTKKLTETKSQEETKKDKRGDGYRRNRVERIGRGKRRARTGRDSEGQWG